ncbi:PAS domain S-box protein [Hymenobacter setariae]|uniref:histidine kinase n=1 Tax=Hymenobacter setariae TaxID=2594794 RepID=A0A558C549_9BACT|nr:ATP-binding protein [Hymenobacter setariae]TVT43742.1 PAS domain S-box protein [Hymenobacter setariae]
MSDYLDLLRPLLEHRNEIYFAYDLGERRVVYVSAAYEQIIGDPSEHINDDLPYLLTRIHPDDWQFLQQRVAQAAPEELVQDVEVRLSQSVKDTQWMQVSVCRRQLPTGAHYLVGSARDITREKEVLINGEKFNSKKNATLEILSHDLAAPLVLLQQLTEHLAWELNTPTSKVQEVLHLMQRTCTQGVSLIRDFVDNEFLESSNVEMRFDRADLVSWLQTLMEEYERSEQHTHLHFHFAATEQPIYVSFDINKLQQVVNNLISNAIKFTPDGGQIAVSLERRGDQALLLVADNGIGIPADLQGVLFDKFTKARRPGLRGERSTGLGMSVIKTIVNLHQGRIWFESTEGQGTTFYLELPALPA